MPAPHRKPCHDPLLDALRDRRRALGLRLLDLEELHGVPDAGDVERGRSAPNLHRLRAFAEALDCDLVLVPRSEPLPLNVTDEEAGVRVHATRVTRGTRFTRSAQLALVVDQMTAVGASANAIADRLGISSRTVVRIRVANAKAEAAA